MGIDCAVFTPGKTNILGSQRPVLLFVGIDFKRKGLDHLIHSLPDIIKEHPYLRLVVVGKSNQSDEMEQLARNDDVHDHIDFLGAIPYTRLPQYFADADLFVLPSLSEGFGLVIIESMSCGTIPIVSDIPPFYDIITDKETGYFVDLSIKGSLAQKINDVLANPEGTKPMRKSARDYVINHFDWAIVSGNYTELIKSM